MEYWSKNDITNSSFLEKKKGENRDNGKNRAYDPSSTQNSAIAQGLSWILS